MGYTHYWDQKKDFTKSQWSAIVGDANSLLTQPLFQIPLEDVTFSTEQIRFNGVEDDGHETFLVTRKKGNEFNFCKTARKPYDLFVGLMLARINHHAKSVLKISSDGDWDDWADIRRAYKSLYGPDLEEFFSK
jgi:hypothetical protein